MWFVDDYSFAHLRRSDSIGRSQSSIVLRRPHLNIFSESTEPIEAKSLHNWSWPHHQDGRIAHIWLQPYFFLLQNHKADCLETWYVASDTPVLYSLHKQ